MMDIIIYQINLSRDDDRVAYLGLSQLDKFQGSSEVNSGIYDKVFEGAVEVDTLEGVYQMFNCDCPEDFQGHSLSVSDVVEIVNGENAGFYFCDRLTVIRRAHTIAICNKVNQAPSRKTS